ncbi:TonB-dependent receptor [Candidatus Foliamicus sp.]
MNSKAKFLPTTSPIALIAALFAVNAAQAQGALEEIVVTAQKRDQSLQDVSVAVTAVSGDELKALGITDSFRLEILAPGLQLGMSGADPRPALRGARTQQVEANDVAISFYTDGLYRPRHGQALAGFVDVDRVEVLRGPQGTLFGRNSFGGLIHVISNRPDPSATDYGFALSGGDYSLAGFDGFFNAPLSDNSAVRLALKTETRDPFVQNITIGDDGGLKDADMTYFRGQLSFAPSDAMDLLFRVESWQDDSNGNGHFGYYPEGVPVNLNTGLTNGVSGTMRPRIGRSDECAGTCGRYGAGFDFVATPGLDTAAPVTGDPYRIADDTPPERDLSELTLAGDLNWALDFADLKVTVAYMDYEEYRWADCDMSAYQTTACGNDITSETNMQEFQLTSNSDGALEWVVGVFLLQEDMTNAFLWEDFASVVDNTPVSPPDINAHATWTNQIRVDTSSAAGYGQASYAVTDATRVLAGVRYTSDERDWQIYGQDPNNTSTYSFTVLEVPDGEGDWSEVTWKAGVELDTSEDTMLYFTVSTGFLAGNQQGAFQGTNSYDEQTVTAYEAGAKSLLADGRVRLNASLYMNQFEDLLSTRFVDTGVTTLAFTDNSGAIDAVGLEVEMDWAVTDQLQLGARMAVQQAEYGDFVLPNVYQEGGQTIRGTDNHFQLDGLQVQNSPDFTATLLGSYTADLAGAGTLIPAITLYYSSDYRVDDSNWFYGNQEAFTKTDLSLTWVSISQDWTARLWVNNIEDEATLLKATRFGGDLAVTDYANPRMWGLTVGYRY